MERSYKTSVSIIFSLFLSLSLSLSHSNTHTETLLKGKITDYFLLTSLNSIPSNLEQMERGGKTFLRDLWKLAKFLVIEAIAFRANAVSILQAYGSREHPCWFGYLAKLVFYWSRILISFKTFYHRYWMHEIIFYTVIRFLEEVTIFT